jgi:hypothetical protein
MPRLRTVFELTAGFGLLLIGGLLALPGIPGPGLLLVAVGLWLLSNHFLWARRLLAWGKERFAHFRHRGGRRAAGLENGQQRASTAARE